MIATVTEDDADITIWDETGNWVAHIHKYSGYKLAGYTSATVSVNIPGGQTLVFNEKGQHIKTIG
ncbi:hypothetical protein Fisuc_2415 [Fibrobacter succinogenes subsp. succinogenes S85]|uniref:Lipoprotein n=1 Tax=Fibrobacter succinogenes (strain ATCC 19169 / S85) TaxID=59374 RepID=A0ABN3Z0G4_FIBSS|nr:MULTISPECIES: hypothetical protein [Fibrobacter]ACX76001.1 hypothetical protein Fisuc_2415 [Fibrobacter succinogenes subsp. succinogenes S85]SMG07059.1 hypothetical protein SAMN05720489_0033 [Fibrobacter sp. UWB13]